MTSSEEEVEIEPLPPHRVRFTDMPWAHVDKAIRRKYINHRQHHFPLLWAFIANFTRHFSSYSLRQGHWEMQAGQGARQRDSNADQGGRWTPGWNRGMACCNRQELRISHHVQDHLRSILRPAWRPSQIVPYVQDTVRRIPHWRLEHGALLSIEMD